jgi:hypothetical protein
MSLRNVVAATAAVLALTALAALIFDWSLERALLLAPVVVLVFGACAGLVVLWTKAALEGIRGRSEN